MANPTTAARIFRQTALDRLSSPEQLDQLIPIIQPRDWVVLSALSAMIALGIAWSFLGTVPVRVKGSGITISAGGRLTDAIAAGEGTLLSLSVVAGSEVVKGQVIAEIEQLGLQQARASAEDVLKDRSTRYATLVSQVDQSARVFDRILASRKQALDAKAHDAEARLKPLEEEIAKEETMFQHHLITWQKLSDSRQALAMTRQTALEARSQAVQADGDAIAQHNNNERELRAAMEQVDEARRHLAEINLQIHQQQEIVSPSNGRVTELKIAPGARVAAGMPILSVESGVTGLELMLYVPPDQGKRVKAGMPVAISPSTVKREEFGTMRGVVKEVSNFPSTAQAMLGTLQNERLVQQLSPQGPPFSVRVMLERDTATPTGYAWTGGRGPNIAVTSGTLADGEVTVEERTPASFVIPWLKKSLGVEG